MPFSRPLAYCEAMTGDVRVHEATSGDLVAVLGVLDAGGLATDADSVRASVDRGDVLVAVPDRGATGSDRGPVVVGALVLDGPEITNVAVRPGRRGRGVGTALVEAAARRRRFLVAEFDAGVRPFYESLGFAVEPLAAGRCRGLLDPGDC